VAIDRRRYHSDFAKRWMVDVLQTTIDAAGSD
jgi:hypothetical protein